jgi:hypothetical protein
MPILIAIKAILRIVATNGSFAENPERTAANCVGAVELAESVCVCRGVSETVVGAIISSLSISLGTNVFG